MYHLALFVLLVANTKMTLESSAK